MSAHVRSTSVLIEDDIPVNILYACLLLQDLVDGLRSGSIDVSLPFRKASTRSKHVILVLVSGE